MSAEAHRVQEQGAQQGEWDAKYGVRFDDSGSGHEEEHLDGAWRCGYRQGYEFVTPEKKIRQGF